MIRSLFLILWTFHFSSAAFAAGAGFVYQGQIIRPDGLALEATNVQFTVEVRTPAPESCLLYRERHTRNMSASNGIYALQVGDGARLVTADPADSATLTDALNKSAGLMSGLTCASGNSYNPSANPTHDYELRVIFNDGSGPNVVAQNHVLRSVPYAMSAQSLNGLEATDLLSVRDEPGFELNQANLESVFTDTNYPELMALLNGTSTQYLSALPGAPFSMNSQRITDLANPTAATDAANKNYVDSYIGGSVANGAVLSTLGAGQAGQVLTWDGNEWTVSTPSMIDATKLPLAGGTMAGAIDMNGNNLVGAGAVSSGSVTTTGAVTVGDSLSVTNGASVGQGLSVGQNLTVTGNASVGGNSTLTGDLSVTGQTSLDQDLLVSGGIGVTNGISSDNYIILNNENELRFGDAGSNYVGFKGPAAAAGAIIWELPGSDGSAGQVLATDGFGQLSWIDPSLAAPVSSVYGRTGAVVAQAGDYSAAQVSNTPAGNIGSTTVQAAINELDTEKASVTALSALDTRVGTAETNITGLSTDLAATDAAVAGLDTRLDTAETDIDNLEAGLATTNTNVTNLDNAKVNRAGDTMTGALNLDNQQQLQLSEADGNGANFVALRAAASLAGNTVWTLPLADGGAGEVLSTDGLGNLSFIAIPSAPVSSVYGRTGAVVAQAGDYNAVQVTSTPVGDLSATDVQAALTELDSEKASVASLAATDTAIAALDTRLDAAETNISTLTSDLAATDGAVTALDGRLDTAETDIDGLETRIGLAEGDLINLDNDKVNRAGDNMSGALQMNAQTELRLADSDSSNYVGLRAPAAIGANYVFTLPDTPGLAGQVLETDGSGNLTWKALAAVGETNVGENLGAGAQVYSGKVGSNLQFRSLAAVNNKVSVAQNGNLIEIGVNEANFDSTAIPNNPAGTIAASTVQGAINELDGEKASITALAATDTAVAALDTRLDSAETDISTLESSVTALSTDKVAKAGDAMTGPLTLNATNEVRFADGDSSNYVGFASPALVTTNQIWTLPGSDGTPGQVLQTDGDGVLNWVSLPSPSSVAGSVDGQIQFKSGSNFAADTALHWDNSNKRLGIGTATPRSPVEIYDGLRLSFTGMGNPNGHTVVLGANANSFLTTPGIKFSSDNTIRHSASDGYFFTLGAQGHTIGVGAWSNFSASGFNFNQPNIINTLPGWNYRLLNFTGTVNSSAPSTTSGLHTTLTDNSSSVANTLIGLSVDVSPGTNTSANRYSAILMGGAVGIGNTSPSSLLDVSGAVTSRPSGTASGQTGQIIMRELAANGTNSVALRAPDSIGSNLIWTLPALDGTPGQVLSTDGAGVLSWVDGAAGAGDFMADGSVPMTGNLRLGNNWLSNDGGSEGLNIDTSGRVGIGTAAEVSHALTVGGQLGLQGELFINGDNRRIYSVSDNLSFMTDTDNNSSGPLLSFGGNGTNAYMVLDNLGHLNMMSEREIRFQDQTGGEFVGFRAPTSVTSSEIWTLPGADGLAGQVLQTNGAGGLSWTTPATGPTVAGSVDGQVQFKSGTNLAADSNLHWDNTNKRLGIGTANPSRNLVVSGTNQDTEIRVINTSSSVVRGPRISIRNYTSGVGGHPFMTLMNSRGNVTTTGALQNNDRIGSYEFVGVFDTVGGYNAAADVTAEAEGNFTSTSSPGRLLFRTTASGASNPEERMRIDSSGRVGIGTTSPSSLLNVSTSSATAYTSTGAGISPSGSSGGVLVENRSLTNSAGAYLRFMSKNAADTDNTAYIGAISTAADSSPAMVFGSRDLGGLSSYSEKMRISPAGNVGIGVTSPTSRLEVNGQIRNTSSVSNGTATINFASGNLQFTTANCQAFTLHNLRDGGVYNFAVKGTTSATCSFTAYSDDGSGAPATELTVHMPKGHGPTTAGKHTVYSIMVMGNDAYFAWVNDFD